MGEQELGECGYRILETHVHVFPTPVGDGHNLQSKAVGILPKVMQGVNLLHIAGRVQAFNPGLYPSMGLVLDFPLLQVAELSVGGVGKFPLQTGPGPRCGGMPLGHFSHS